MIANALALCITGVSSVATRPAHEPQLRKVFSQLQVSYWSRVKYALSGCHPIGHTVRPILAARPKQFYVGMSTNRETRIKQTFLKNRANTTSNHRSAWKATTAIVRRVYTFIPSMGCGAKLVGLLLTLSALGSTVRDCPEAMPAGLAVLAMPAVPALLAAACKACIPCSSRAVKSL
jgi:hypothetical protein